MTALLKQEECSYTHAGRWNWTPLHACAFFDRDTLASQIFAAFWARSAGGGAGSPASPREGGLVPPHRPGTAEVQSLTAAQDERGYTPLHLACARNSGRMVELLLSKSTAELSAQCGKDANTPAHLAALNDQADVLRQLSANTPLCLLTKNGNGDLPLHLAAAACTLSALQVLIDACCGDGRSGLNIKNNAGETPMLVAAAHGHHLAVAALLQAGASPSELSNSSFTALHVAAASNHVKVAEALLSEPKPALRVADSLGNTALHIAALNGSDAITALLLEKDNDLASAVNKNKDTPLHCAALLRDSSTARLLAAAVMGGELRQNAQGATAAHLAAAHGNLDVLKLFGPGLDKLSDSFKLHLGGTVFDYDHSGVDFFSCTPLHAAAYFGQLETLEYLLPLAHPADLVGVKGCAMHLATVAGQFSTVRAIDRWCLAKNFAGGRGKFYAPGSTEIYVGHGNYNSPTFGQRMNCAALQSYIEMCQCVSAPAQARSELMDACRRDIESQFFLVQASKDCARAAAAAAKAAVK